MVAEVDEAADSHAVALLEVGQGPLDDGLELRRGPQQEAPLDDAAGDLDQMVVVGQVAQLASHARGDGSRPGFLAGFLWHLKLGHLKLGSHKVSGPQCGQRARRRSRWTRAAHGTVAGSEREISSCGMYNFEVLL